MRRAIAFFIFTLMVFLFVGQVNAMTSESYSLPWDSINSGGEETSTSTNYALRDTAGEQALGSSTGTVYSVQAGYRIGDRDVPYLQFLLFTQNSAVVSSYSSFDSAGKKVTVASPGLFSVGDMIEVVENMGISQKVAIGKVYSKSGSQLSVDRWDGSTATMNISPAGTSNVYKMQTGTSVDFGSLQGTVYASAITGTRVSTSAPNGYTVYITASGGLRSGIHEIANVADGLVSSGQEEYGFHVSGSAAATSTAVDHPFLTSTGAIQQSASAVPAEGICLEYKLSVIPSTVSGAHTQTVTYTVTANF